MRGLIVDDDDFVAELLIAVLEGAGHKIVRVDAGIPALATVSVMRFDYVILDIEMPDLSGFEVARELARRGVETPVILVSGHEVDPEKIEAAGAEFLGKPFGGAQVLDAIARVTARKRARSSS